MWAQTELARSFLRLFRWREFAPSQENWPTPQAPGQENPGEERASGRPSEDADGSEDRAQASQQHTSSPGRLADTAQALPPGILQATGA